jgi:hypothetical protein
LRRTLAEPFGHYAILQFVRVLGHCGVKIPVLKLERIIASKKAAGREKDKIVLGVLSDALKAIRERS